MPARLYVLPKIVHKPEDSLRSIIRTCGALSYILATFLAVVLCVHLGKSLRHVKDSDDRMRRPCTLRISTKDTALSFVLACFLTKMTLKDGLNLFNHHDAEDNYGTLSHISWSRFRVSTMEWL